MENYGYADLTSQLIAQEQLSVEEIVRLVPPSIH